MKRILITGANSYIGESVRSYLLSNADEYLVDIVDTLNWTPSKEALSGYDVVFNVAGIAHVKETKNNRELYYKVNRDLIVEIAKLAKSAGVKQFIALSTMSVYGLNIGYIKKSTQPRPINAYGKSKYQADEIIKKLECASFKYVCLRPPMVYGKGCKGNYQSLRLFAIKSPFFPAYSNKRSMIYIGNLCEFVKQCIDEERRGVFFPQNAEYVNTSEMVSLIAKVHGRKIKLTKAFNWALKIAPFSIIKKVFGDLIYEPVDMVDKISFEDSVILTEE